MKGIKETNDKLIYDIDFNYITGMAERMQLNRDKYPVGDWQKPIDVDSLKQALFRHVIEIMQGRYDDEQRFGHLYAIGCNAFMIIEQLKNCNYPELEGTIRLCNEIVKNEKSKKRR